MRTLKRILYRWIDKRFLAGCSCYNSLEVRKSCRSKLQARRAFQVLQVPHAKGEIFINPLKALHFARDNGFPLVVKPNVSGFSRGSHFPINSIGELLWAIFWAKGWWPVSVVEEYLEGKNYRVVAIEGEIMSVIRRYAPFVDGDGQSTISQLIDRENAVRKRMGLGPVIHPIPKDRRITGYLKKRGLHLDCIPAEGQRIGLYHKVALAPGGIVEVVDRKTLPPENQALFLDLVDHFQANILGIDAIFEEGIDQSYHNQKSILLEINSRPYLKMHDFPRFGEREDLSGFYSKLDGLDINHQDIF